MTGRLRLCFQFLVRMQVIGKRIVSNFEARIGGDLSPLCDFNSRRAFGRVLCQKKAPYDYPTGYEQQCTIAAVTIGYVAAAVVTNAHTPVPVPPTS